MRGKITQNTLAPGATHSMKKYFGLLKYFSGFRQNIILYFLFTILSVIFGIVSIGMLIPFLQMLFSSEAIETVKPVLEFSSTSLLKTLNYHLGTIITANGKTTALGIVCLVIIGSILFKNMFLYLSYVVLSPMRNAVMTRLRNDMYLKILELPIGFFTEQRKGDIISRMTNDTWELEGTAMSTMEGLIKEPLTLLVYLFTLVFFKPAIVFVLIDISSAYRFYHRSRKQIIEEAQQCCSGEVRRRTFHIR